MNAIAFDGTYLLDDAQIDLVSGGNERDDAFLAVAGGVAAAGAVFAAPLVVAAAGGFMIGYGIGMLIR